MGLYLAKAVEKLASTFSLPKPTKILLLGLDGAGKTTVVYRLKLNEYMSTVPTIGFNVETIEYKNLKMTIWDVGSQKKMMELWRHYYEHTDALIFVVDSCDEERMELASEKLHSILSDEKLRDIPVLVFANKQDISKLKPNDIVNKFDMHKMRRSWKVQGDCATVGEGLNEGLDWVAQEIKKSKK